MRRATRPEVQPEVDRPNGSDAARPVVPRRRVGGVVHLADGSSLSGDLYAAVTGEQARSEPIFERLNDPGERYLPLAHGNHHFLLNKSSVRFVELAHVEAARDADPMSAKRSFRVEVTLDSGEAIRGVMEPRVRAAHYRTLDHLNDSARGFLRIVRSPGVVYVNHDHVVAVHDLIGP